MFNTDVVTMTNVTASTAEGRYAIAVYNTWADVVMQFVTADASGAEVNGFGVLSDSSTVTMTHVIATAIGSGNGNYAISNEFSSQVTMVNVTANAAGGGSNNYGIANNVSGSTLNNSTVSTTGGTQLRRVQLRYPPAHTP